MKNITRILTVILIICIVFSLIASIVSRPVDLYKIERDPSSLLSHIDGWTFSDGSKAEFNSKKDTSSISVYKSITENEVKFSAIGFNNYGQNVEAYIDGTLIYSLRAAKDLGASSDILCIINLPENLHPGQNLKISLSSSHTAEVPKIYGGSFFEFIALHILPRLPHFMLLLVNALVILIVSTAFIYKRIRVLLLKNNVHWFLLFLTMATLWVLTDTRIIQILRPDGFISGYILSFESFFLMTVPFMIFLKKVIKSFNTIGSIAVVSLFLNFIAMNILNFTGIYLFYESIWITHVILIKIIILAVICIIYDYIKYRNAYSRALMISIGVFVSFSLIEIINYWRSGKVSDSATLFFQIGFLMFILTQLVFLMNYSSRLIFEGMKSEQYYNLAMTDAITGIPNRLAYSEKLKNLQKLESESEAIALYCDLNNLKETNGYSWPFCWRLPYYRFC